ncbi:hypothetical protein E4T66_18565 [Sinimarinibacterium sp. CAU 1509]|uniref:hypothetical protein n=1 Tax=Sinimarinibacterium sp. CAU 1509 TaxID=2562283 RepID=UPI0010ACB6A8|nr:hypothetical protein [Sinimarinibacterium sp. CAU 1509]TJY57411.1 hypothetical protein E4T66_18565 [Sinimarinibacterium sp. CAU 1509]
MSDTASTPKSDPAVLAALSASLAPCPWCGAGETQLEEKTHWTGMRSVVLSARVMHWCPRKDGQPQSVIQIAGRDAATAAAAWNSHTGAMGARADASEIDRLREMVTELWHAYGGGALSLRECLGMSEEDYAQWAVHARARTPRR